MKWTAIAPNVSSSEVGTLGGGLGGGWLGGVGWPAAGPTQHWQDRTLVYCPANELMARSGY